MKRKKCQLIYCRSGWKANFRFQSLQRDCHHFKISLKMLTLMTDQSSLLSVSVSYGDDTMSPCLEVGTYVVYQLFLVFQISFSHPF